MGNIATRAGAVGGGLSHGISVSPATFRAGDSVSVFQEFPLDYTQTINQLVIDGVAATPTVVSADQIDFLVPETVSDGAGKTLQLTADGFQATATVNILPPLTIEPEVNAAIQAIVAAGGTVSQTEQVAANVFINGLKTNNLFTSAPLIYLFLGGNAGGHAINWRNPGTNNITWVGGLTHNSSGVRGDGTSGYGNTGYPPSNVNNQGAFIITLKDRGTNGTTAGFIGTTNARGISGIVDSGGQQRNRFRFSQNGLDVPANEVPVTGSIGLTKLNASNILISNNGNSVVKAIASPNTVGGGALAVLATINETNGVPGFFSDGLAQAAMVFNVNLSDSQLNLVTSALRDFQVAIGR